MKRCTRCNQVYADDLSFCLSDGTPLVGMLDDAEQKTVVRPAAPLAVEQQTVVRTPVTGTKQAGESSSVLKIVAAAAVLLLILIAIGGAAAAYLLWPSRDVATVANNTAGNWNSKSPPGPTPAPTDGTNSSNSSVKDREDALERERKRLADERTKLEDEKRRRDAEDDDEDPPEPPPPPTFKDPGPSRLSFGRGSTGTTVSGTVGKSRSYMLRAMNGQYLNASVSSSGGCVIFSSGGSSTQFSTGAGDTYLYLKNTCSAPSKFSLSVTVR